MKESIRNGFGFAIGMVAAWMTIGMTIGVICAVDYAVAKSKRKD